MKPFPARNPVFVDSTGRRHRTIRRTGALLALPAIGYLVLLASSLLGGPRVDTPLIPLPEAGRQQPAPRPNVKTAPVQAADTPRPDETSESTPDPSSTPTLTPGDSPTSTPTIAPSITPSPTPSTGKPTKTPTAVPSTPGHGKPVTPPGRTKSPTKP